VVRRLVRDAWVVGHVGVWPAALVPGLEGEVGATHGQADEAGGRDVLVVEVLQCRAVAGVGGGATVLVAVLLVCADRSNGLVVSLSLDQKLGTELDSPRDEITHGDTAKVLSIQ
jgi:hypothetical protein